MILLITCLTGVFLIISLIAAIAVYGAKRGSVSGKHGSDGKGPRKSIVHIGPKKSGAKVPVPRKSKPLGLLDNPKSRVKKRKSKVPEKRGSATGSNSKTRRKPSHTSGTERHPSKSKSKAKAKPSSAHMVYEPKEIPVERKHEDHKRRHLRTKSIGGGGAGLASENKEHSHTSNSAEHQPKVPVNPDVPTEEDALPPQPPPTQEVNAKKKCSSSDEGFKDFPISEDESTLELLPTPTPSPTPSALDTGPHRSVSAPNWPVPPQQFPPYFPPTMPGGSIITIPSVPQYPRPSAPGSYLLIRAPLAPGYPAGSQRPPAGSQRPPGGPQRPPGGKQMPPGGPQMPPGGPHMPPGSMIVMPLPNTTGVGLPSGSMLFVPPGSQPAGVPVYQPADQTSQYQTTAANLLTRRESSDSDSL